MAAAPAGWPSWRITGARPATGLGRSWRRWRPPTVPRTSTRSPTPGATSSDAIELWDDVPDAEALVGSDLSAVLYDASWAMGVADRPSLALALARRAVERFDGAPDSERAAMLDERLAWAATEFGDVALATELLTSALDRIGSAPPSRAQVVVLTCYARNIYIRGLDGAVPAAERAIAAARTVDVPFAEADALVTLAGALRDMGDPDAAIGHLREAIAIAERLDDVWELGRAYDHLAGAFRERGDIEQAIEVARAGFERARRSGAGGSFGPKYALDHAWMLVTVGRWSEARHYIDEAALLRPEGIMRLLYCATAGWLETLSGDFDAAHRLLDEGRALGAELRDPRWAAWLLVVGAQLELLEGRPLGARREVAEGLLGGPRYQELTFAGRIGLEAEADIAELGRARHRDAEVAEARTRADELLARSRALVATFPDPASPTVRWLEADLTTAEAELTRLEGRSDPAAWTAVAARWEALSQPYEAAYARYRAAEALLAAGHRRSEAEAELRAAHGVAATLGARPLQARIEALARRGRIDLACRGARASSTRRPISSSTAEAADPFGLTTREREVLALLAEGRTNRQIGDALFISSSTAGVHVSNILGKLGVTTPDGGGGGRRAARPGELRWPKCPIWGSGAR